MVKISFIWTGFQLVEGNSILKGVVERFWLWALSGEQQLKRFEFLWMFDYDIIIFNGQHTYIPRFMCGKKVNSFMRWEKYFATGNSTSQGNWKKISGRFKKFWYPVCHDTLILFNFYISTWELGLTWFFLAVTHLHSF